MRLAEVFGQNAAVSRLRRALEQKRVPHAYLFEGPDGVGKLTAAKALGLALLCRTMPGVGCGTCETCTRAEAGLHPDLRVFAPQGRDIKKEEADEVVALASERPHEAPARLLIIDEADKLNANAANCLLKTLEEPAPGSHLVLVSSAGARLLDTILSRTQRIRFSPLPTALLAEQLQKRGVPEDRAAVAAALANGSFSRAVALADGEEDEATWVSVTRLRQAAAGRTVGNIMDTANMFAGKEGREPLVATLDLLARLYRDALVSAGGAPELAVLSSKRAEINDIIDRAGAAPLPRIRKALDALAEADEALAGNVNAVTAVEALIFSLRSLEFRRNTAQSQ
ncbi:MAG: DNA polymerase III subunit delta' [Deltaproteobacteria bacterium]|nr:DNA polymerase III subunit delta' [Deltaproteobacteria bacterium]